MLRCAGTRRRCGICCRWPPARTSRRSSPQPMPPATVLASALLARASVTRSPRFRPRAVCEHERRACFGSASPPGSRSSFNFMMKRDWKARPSTSRPKVTVFRLIIERGWKSSQIRNFRNNGALWCSCGRGPSHHYMLHHLEQRLARISATAGTRTEPRCAYCEWAGSILLMLAPVVTSAADASGVVPSA